MNRKKEVLLQTLSALEPYSTIMSGLKIFVNSKNITEKSIDLIIEILQKIIKSTSDSIKKVKLENSISGIAKIKTNEDFAKIKELEDAEKLLLTI